MIYYLKKFFWALRKKDGLNLAELSQEYGFNIKDFIDKLNYYIPQKFYHYENSFMTLTEEGFLISNSINIEIYSIISNLL